MRRVTIIIGVAVVLCVSLAWPGGPALDVLGGLALGWLTYPSRVLPRVRIAWDGVATGVLCLALFTFGLHRTLKWFYEEVQGASGAAVGTRRPWSARWTISLVVLIVVMFAVGISATGVVHQTGWLIASRRSLVEKKPRFFYSQVSSVNNLREIGLGAYSLVVVKGSSRLAGPHRKGERLHSWMTAILPYTSFTVGGELRQDMAWNDPRNSAYFKGFVPIYLNPKIVVLRSPEGYALSHYAGNVHVLGEKGAWPRVGTGGAANTILAGEVAEGFKPWGDPSNLRDPGLGVNTVPGGFGGPSGSGVNFLFVDGSVRFLRDTTSRDVLRRLSLPGPSH